MRKILPWLLSPFALLAQNDDYAKQTLRYDDYVYRQNIRTVMCHESTWEYAAPLINLGSADHITLSFDDLDADQKQYSVAFVHCNADWTPSDLMTSEYLGGFYDLNFLNYYTFSQNTYQKYTHYEITFPQSNMQFIKSGNFVLYVYADGDQSNVVLSRRMMVYDSKVSVGPTIRQPIGGGNQYTQQHIDFTINPAGYNITNSYKDLHVTITQNNRWDNAVTGIQPTFINGNLLTYSLDDATTFSAGNEFRYFDTRSLRFLTERVKEIYRDNDLKNHVILQQDEVRSRKPYLFYNDLNGNYLIRNREAGGDMAVEADYVYVHFFLKYPVEEPGGTFYVMGKLTDWRMNARSKMTYNSLLLGYEVTLYLKQGYYNYEYVFSKDGKTGNEALAEGSFWDTENDYNIYVYHRKFGTYYDQLIGVQKLNSLKH